MFSLPYCFLLLAVPLPVHHMKHHFESLNIMEDAAYHVFLDHFVVVATFGVFIKLCDVVAVLVGKLLSVLVARYSSFCDF